METNRQLCGVYKVALYAKVTKNNLMQKQGGFDDHQIFVWSYGHWTDLRVQSDSQMSLTKHTQAIHYQGLSKNLSFLSNIDKEM